jgi:hypothetical protein
LVSENLQGGSAMSKKDVVKLTGEDRSELARVLKKGKAAGSAAAQVLVRMWRFPNRRR